MTTYTFSGTGGGAPSGAFSDIVIDGCCGCVGATGAFVDVLRLCLGGVGCSSYDLKIRFSMMKGRGDT